MDDFGYATSEEIALMSPEEILKLKGIKKTLLLTPKEFVEFKQRFGEQPTNKSETK